MYQTALNTMGRNGLEVLLYPDNSNVDVLELEYVGSRRDVLEC